MAEPASTFTYDCVVGRTHDGEAVMAQLPYDENTPLDVPVEVRLSGARKTYIASAWLDSRGMVGHGLGLPGDDQGHSISNLQCTGTLPRKAVPGWQAEFIAFVASGLYSIAEVR